MLHSIWVLFLTNGMRLSILSNLAPFVTSSFQSHSLLAVINIVAYSMAAATYIPMAKVLDVWGRAEGFALMVAMATLGLVLMAVSDNLATFCAAQVSLNWSRHGYVRSLLIIPRRSSIPLAFQASFIPSVCSQLM
jgi:hypothetical protein